MTVRRAALAALTLAVAVAPGRAAFGKPLPERRTGLNRFAGRLHVDVGLQDLFWGDARARLRSGFVTRVLIRVSVFPEGSNQSVANTFRRVEILYDIWEEHFRIWRQEGEERAGITKDERFSVATEAEAIRLGTALVKFPVASLEALRPGQRYRVAFRADLNPLSQELVADVQRSLTRPEGRRGGESLFGSFVSIFVKARVDDSERQLRFVSQPFWEPRR